MCRALKVLCAAGDADALGELKRAAVGRVWELVAGAVSVEELAAQIERWEPDIVVVDESLGAEAARLAAGTGLRPRVVTVGGSSGGPDHYRQRVQEAIVGAPRPGGPVTG